MIQQPSPHRFIRALLRQPVDCTPIWIMRQAGRYLPEYRELRKQAGNFLNLCKTPELAAEATLQPLRRFDLDAGIIFSDILTIPDAMGLGLYFGEGEGPKFKYPVQNEAAIQNLIIPDSNSALGYVAEAIRLVKKELGQRLPLIGFSGSPWTLATYMVEGGSSKNFSIIKAMLYQNSQALHVLLNKLAQSVIAYLNMQIEAGADAVMIFDTWGGVLTESAYLEFSLAYMQLIAQGIHRYHDNKIIPLTFFTKQGGLWLEAIANSGCDAVGIDWTVNIAHAKQLIGERVAIQGNLDPCVLYAKPDIIRPEAQKIITAFGSTTGHVFNLGHGIHPDIPPEHVAALIEAVHQFSEN